MIRRIDRIDGVSYSYGTPPGVYRAVSGPFPYPARLVFSMGPNGKPPGAYRVASGGFPSSALAVYPISHRPILLGSDSGLGRIDRIDRLVE